MEPKEVWRLTVSGLSSMYVTKGGWANDPNGKLFKPMYNGCGISVPVNTLGEAKRICINYAISEAERKQHGALNMYLEMHDSRKILAKAFSKLCKK